MLNKTIILVDAHVHIYDCYDIKIFFNSAIKNFEASHNKLKLTQNFTGVLFFTETGKTNYFNELCSKADHYSGLLDLHIEPTSEADSLRINLHSGNYLIIIAGQQIITSENLEVQALGTTKKIDDGNSLYITINEIKKINAVPVIPWGAGKWFGKRGKIVGDIIQNSKEIFLGDNSGRPVFWGEPKLFREGLKKQIYTIRGSDPLPLKSQEMKPGSFGFYFISEINLDEPVEFLKKYFKSLNKAPDNYGKLESPVSFLKNQFFMQLKKINK